MLVDNNTLATYCPISCGSCTPTQGGGQCSDVDDDIFAIDAYGLSCSALAHAGLCTAFNQTTMAERCTVACGFCAPPLSVPCWEDDDMPMVSQFGVSCSALRDVRRTCGSPLCSCPTAQSLLCVLQQHRITAHGRICPDLLLCDMPHVQSICGQRPLHCRRQQRAHQVSLRPQLHADGCCLIIVCQSSNLTSSGQQLSLHCVQQHGHPVPD